MPRGHFERGTLLCVVHQRRMPNTGVNCWTQRPRGTAFLVPLFSLSLSLSSLFSLLKHLHKQLPKAYSLHQSNCYFFCRDTEWSTIKALLADLHLPLLLQHTNQRTRRIQIFCYLSDTAVELNRNFPPIYFMVSQNGSCHFFDGTFFIPFFLSLSLYSNTIYFKARATKCWTFRLSYYISYLL